MSRRRGVLMFSVISIIHGLILSTSSVLAGSQSGKPDIMPFSFSKNAALGQKAMLTCAVTSDSESLEIQWSHNGRRVENTASKYATFVTANIATLTIETVSADDMGNYTCTASTRLGRDSYTAALVVEGELLQKYTIRRG